jgi:hypothetical protein
MFVLGSDGSVHDSLGMNEAIHEVQEGRGEKSGVKQVMLVDAVRVVKYIAYLLVLA